MEKTTLLTKRACLFIVFICLPLFGFSQTSVSIYNGTTSWNCPVGVTTILVEAWGGGGAGGSRTSGSAAYGGGGGGAYAKQIVSVIPGTSYPVSVGSGSSTTSSGGDSYFLNITTILAKGGNSVPNNSSTGATGGSASSSIGYLTFAGGNGANGSGSNGGGGGSSAGSSSAGNSGVSSTGGTAPTGGGNGGNGKSGSGGNGTDGAVSGGGGGGAYRTSGSVVGGSGANGKIIISYGPPLINIQGNSISIPNNNLTTSSTDGTDFGTTQIVSSPITKSFTIQNTGVNTLTIGTISFSGTDAGDFSVVAPQVTSIVGGSSSTLVIKFNPSSSGTRTAIISIPNNDSTKNPYTFTIKGTGNQTFFDSDDDGIFDNVDIDDDNDGIKDTTEETNCNLFNGSKVNYKFLYETFGAGTTRTTINTTYDATTTYCYQDATTPSICEGSSNSTDLNDGKYTVGSSAQIASWADGLWYKGGDHTGDTNGRMALFNASYTPGIFYTALITGTLPNVPITYSFWVLNLDRTDASGIATRLRPNIKVEFRDINDNLLQTIFTGDIPPTTAGDLNGSWIQFTSNLTFNVSTFKVVFINNNTGGLGNDLALDDILINQTLCDRDGDGIADVFDLDSDNDGIPDVVEAGLGSISNGKGKIDVAWVDGNGDGLHDSAESSAALSALDSDGDGVPNYLDLDSDNDSAFDVDESGVGNTNAVAGYNNGDGDINGDGTGDGPDSETFRSKDTNGDLANEGYGDGILDIFDYGTGSTFSDQYGNSGQGTANTTYPAATYLKDTDGDGIPDYIDVYNNITGIFDIAYNKLIYNNKVLDADNDGILDGNSDVDKDGILDIFDTNTAKFGSPRDLNTKLFLDFDGRNDYGQSTSILGGLASASLMAWIDLNPAFSTTGIIIGQDKFQIRITSGKNLEAVVNGTTITDTTVLNVSQWYNVGATYDGATIKLYLNGVLVQTKAATGAISTDSSLLTIGKSPSLNTNYFKGKIDEVRVFNLALSDSQLQRMVYQEISNFGSEIRGEIVPKNIATSPSSLPFANLLRYYRMDVYKDDVIDDLTTPTIDLTGTKIYNHKNIYVQQAPMPFVTVAAGSFATAVNSPATDVRGQDIMDNDFSIVKVKHDITETSNAIDLGMFVDPGKSIIMNNDTKIQNGWYLKLDGKIDLVGKSQLVQTIDSDLDVTSLGSIERDQQGQSNVYNYNYWCSPVGPINVTANNTNYTVDGVMKDGFNAIPRNINWISGLNGIPGNAVTPVSLTRYWLYTFDNKVDAYANWGRVTETSFLRAGQGYTLKGSGAASYFTFVGKPNNGTINTNTILAENLLLVGNPYPSAIDAYQFINDNIASVRQNGSGIDGTLYFWEHASNNNTHILVNYLGGYAMLNLVGGISPVVPAGISGIGLSSKIPKQYIPVGQGFFVYGKSGIVGSVPVVFNNGQRNFVKETDPTSTALFRTKLNQKTNQVQVDDDTSVTTDTYKRIRLGYNTIDGYHRQVLLGFMDEKATNGIDYGYDALNIDGYPNDMYFLSEENQLVIQGVGFFDVDASYPIGVKTSHDGAVSFIVDEMENFDAQQNVFIYDNLTDTYHNIRNEKYEVQMSLRKDNTRFSLRFKDNKTLGVDENTTISNEIKVMHIQSENTLVITNDTSNVLVEKITLFNILGQSIANWNIENQEQKTIQIPVKNISDGVYIAKLKTSKGEISKKIIF